MPQEIRLWAVEDEKKPKEVLPTKIGLEKRLHDWLEDDISMLDPNLLVIGREVTTKYGGRIDLLCIDSDGDLVAVELKQGATEREVTAQALDYASWVKDLTADEIEGIAERYPKIDSLQEALRARFEPSPSTLNENHRSLIVAEAIDEDSERIVRYLSELGVPINVATVQAFKDASGQEMLAQVFLIERDVAQDRADRAHTLSRKKKYRTAAEMEALADDNCLGDLYRRARSVGNVLKAPRYYEEDLCYHWYSEDGEKLSVFAVSAAKPDNGGMRFEAHATRFNNHLKISLTDLRAMLPTNVREGNKVWSRSSPGDTWLLGTFHTLEEVDTFVAKLTEAVERLDEN